MARTLMRWSPFNELEQLQGRIDRMLNDEEGDWRLAVDVIEREDAFVVRADAPGFSPEDIEIEVEDGILTISAEHEETEEQKKDKYVRRERRYGAFSRSFALPKGVAADEIKATCSHGTVEVAVPKPRRQEPKAVTIKPTGS